MTAFEACPMNDAGPFASSAPFAVEVGVLLLEEEVPSFLTLPTA
jgi:hypothetical protein